jgi:hypothetical protein
MDSQTIKNEQTQDSVSGQNQTPQSKPQTDTVGRKHYSTFNLTLFVFKIILVVIVVYLSIAFGYAAFLPYNYGRDRVNFLHTLATSSIQPYMDVFGHGKISHFYDWREIPDSEVADEYFSLQIRSNSEQKTDHTSDQSKILYDFRQSSEVAIIEPTDYQSPWSLIKCTAVAPSSNQKICLRSNLTHKGAIRYSIDGQSEVWGVDNQNKPIVLKITEYKSVDQHRHLPLI